MNGPVQVPTVHLNGTARQELQEQLLGAIHAVDAATAALCKAAPNARDYYVKSNVAAMLAAAEHRARLGKLAEVKAELHTMMEAVL